MAADVTLLAVDPGATFAGLSAWETAEYQSFKRWFDDDTLHRDEAGNVTMYSSGEQRAQLQAAVYEGVDRRSMSWFEVGPWSPLKHALGMEEIYGGRGFMPGPTVGVYDFFDGHPWVMTRGVRRAVLARMNWPEGDTVYRRRRGRGSRRKLGLWLADQMGRVVWAESW